METTASRKLLFALAHTRPTIFKIERFKDERFIMKNTQKQNHGKAPSPSIRPQDNFFQYINGAWLAKQQIPAHKSEQGTFSLLVDKNENKLLANIEHLQKKPAPRSLHEQQIIDIYQSFMDTTEIDAQNISPISPQIKLIHHISNVSSLISAMVELHTLGVSIPFLVKVDIDFKNTNSHILSFSQDGLTLPNKMYYNLPPKKSGSIDSKITTYFSSLFQQANIDEPEQKAEKILAIETEIATGHWEQVDCRDFDKIYNKLKFSQIIKDYRNLHWEQICQSLGTKIPHDIIIYQPSYFLHLCFLIKKFNLSDWKSYLLGHLLNTYAPYLSKGFENIHFNFHRKTLQGIETDKQRAQRAIYLINHCIGDAMGQVFIDRHYNKKMDKSITVLCQNLLSAFEHRIHSSSWLASKTKIKAIQKIKNIKFNIGKPEKWKSYHGLKLSKKTLIENIQNARIFNFTRTIDKLLNPVDPNEWIMLAQTVNACYDPHLNTIIIPAAILQPPLYDMHKPMSTNYGAIGAIISHELSHAFDDQGSKFDAMGNLNNWWTAADQKSFQEKSQSLVEQYDQYSQLDTMTVDGKLTLGENIADLSGVSVSLHALKNNINSEKNKAKEIFLFFKSWANTWRSKCREEEIMRRLKIDPHAPAEFRVNGVLSNIDEFHNHYDTTADDKMYIPHSKRVHFW